MDFDIEMFYLSPRALRMLKVERTMIRESNRISNRIPLCIIGGAVFLWNEKLGLFKNGRVSKAIIQKFFLILTNILPWKEQLIVKKSKQTRKSQRLAEFPPPPNPINELIPVVILTCFVIKIWWICLSSMICHGSYINGLRF